MRCLLRMFVIATLLAGLSGGGGGGTAPHTSGGCVWDKSSWDACNWQ